MKGWSIALVVILIVLGSLGSVYLLRAVGELSIEIEALKGEQEVLENFKATAEETFKTLEAAQGDLQEQMTALDEENQGLEETLTFLKEKFVALPGVLTRLGTIDKMAVASGHIELAIDAVEVIEGEEAMRYLMETYGYSIQSASEALVDGRFRIDLENDGVTYRLRRESMIYLVKEDEVAEATLEELVAYVQQTYPPGEEPLFSFYVIESEIVEIKEVHLP